ncbi:hypothetical protein ABT008_14385 [Micromonospora sp. NPDC002389]|uniref:hypothetical protein n=1 Tax=Micromonospora sp. NPDC002389 TaxID=3154272 RepID=UPI00331BA4CC
MRGSGRAWGAGWRRADVPDDALPGCRARRHGPTAGRARVPAAPPALVTGAFLAGAVAALAVALLLD